MIFTSKIDEGNGKLASGGPFDRERQLARCSCSKDGESIRLCDRLDKNRVVSLRRDNSAKFRGCDRSCFLFRDEMNPVVDQVFSGCVSGAAVVRIGIQPARDDRKSSVSSSCFTATPAP